MFLSPQENVRIFYNYFKKEHFKITVKKRKLGMNCLQNCMCEKEYHTSEIPRTHQHHSS